MIGLLKRAPTSEQPLFEDQGNRYFYVRGSDRSYSDSYIEKIFVDHPCLKLDNACSVEKNGLKMMSEPIDITKILAMLPHRYPFLLVDRVLEYKEFDYLKAIKNVTINEPFFNGHFPGNPIMPGVLMLEGLAQSCALLSRLSQEPKEGYGVMYYFAGIDNAKFKQVVVPGDQLRYEVKFTSQKRDFWRMHGEVFVGEKLACSADLLSAVKEYKK